MFPNLALNVLHGTPVWVFVLFAFLLRMGLQQLQPTVRTLRRVWLTPLLFIAWGLIGLFNRTGTAGEIVGWWLAGAGIGALIAMPLNQPMQVDRRHGLVRQPGSVVPLLRNMGLYFAHYLLHVAAAMQPQARDSLAAWDIVVSGISAGYFIAWGIRFAQGYARAPETDLGGHAVAPMGASRELAR